MAHHQARISKLLISPCFSVLLLTLSAIAANTAFADECETIRFERGQSAGTVKGVAPPDDMVCHEITTDAGQNATVAVNGINVMFSIEGVIDGQERHSLMTKAQRYKIYVGQLMRSVTDEPFTLTVSVK